ncbi:dihydrodipicolinate synthase family protein [Candidatus Poriferisocius sp.]|uniref:dihydrodipicolinate synthase family protein n=1 Tax=Candidatus Poriferisocius sp. TaxID=3101276 RepID=UPI003B592647
MAALTPWDDDGRLDLAAWDAQVEWLADQSPLGIGVAGVEVQEYHLLDDATRVDLVRRTVERVGETPVVAGVTSPMPRTSAALARQMHDVGASAVLALCGPKPWAAPMTQTELVGWFTRLADGSPLPVVLYSNPRTGSDPTVAALAELAAHESIVALKETSRDMVKVLGLCEQLSKPGLAGVYNNMETLLATLLLGGEGAMVPAPALGASQRIFSAVAAGDLDTARHWQGFFSIFPSRWMGLGLGPVCKAAMGVLGVPVGRPPAPFETLGHEQVREVADTFARWELSR